MIIKNQVTGGAGQKPPFYTGKPVVTVLLAGAVVIAALIGAALLVTRSGEPLPQAYPVRGFSNMCAYEGKVYRGVNGAYGEPIPIKTSIFTMQEGSFYYVEKVQQAHESMTDELLSICKSDLSGANRQVLADDVFLAGAGYEKLIGDRLFYGQGYDENYRMKYVALDLASGKKSTVASDRIDHILGYDGTYLYYAGYDPRKEENLLGRVKLKTGKDETLAVYPPVDEVGSIDTALYEDGELYCLTLLEKPEGYDYRTYSYGIQIRDAGNGKVTKELPFTLAGSSNYSMLVKEGKLYYSADGKIMEYELIRTCDGETREEATSHLDAPEKTTSAAVAAKNESSDKPSAGDTEKVAAPEASVSRQLARMKPQEYWGILHFIPGDGYLYYEAIAEIDETTGNNDYFYRVPLRGGEPELLSEWFTQ